MSSLNHETEDYIAKLSEASPDDVEFKGIGKIAHEGYEQSRGRLILNGEKFKMTVTELDDSYSFQIRGEEGRYIKGVRVNSEDPNGALPESDEELCSLYEDDIL